MLQRSYGLSNRQSPANSEKLPGQARGLFDSKLDILALGELRMVAKALDNDVAQATVLVDSSVVDILDRVGELGRLKVVRHLAGELGASERLQTGNTISVRDPVSRKTKTNIVLAESASWREQRANKGTEMISADMSNERPTRKLLMQRAGRP